MYPILLKFGFIQIYSYGLMVASAFLVSTFLLSRRVFPQGQGEGKDFFWNLSSWILFWGIIGGRMSYIILNLRFFLENPREIFAFWHGGLVWYGGLLGGILSGALYLKLHKKASLNFLDLLAPYVALGQSIGRIGCFLNGCCYGRPDYLIPAQLFSSLDLLLIFIILRLLQDKPHRPGFIPRGQETAPFRERMDFGRSGIPPLTHRVKGSIFVIYLLLSSGERFLMEYLRNDSPRGPSGLTVFQVISLGVFLGAIGLWCIILWFQKRIRANG